MVRPWSCEIQRGLHLSRNRYFGGSARHSNRFACRDHAVTLSYSLVRLGFVAQGAPAATTTSVKSKTSIRIRWQSEAAIIITPSASGARRYVALKDGQAERCGAPEEVAWPAATMPSQSASISKNVVAGMPPTATMRSDSARRRAHDFL